MRPMLSLVCACVCSLACPPRASASPPASPSLESAQREPEPPRGRGLYAAGIFGVTFGIFNIGYGIPLAITGPGDAYFSGYIPIAFGASFIALGAVGIHYGKRRRAVWRACARCQAFPDTPLLGLRRRAAQPPHVPWLIVGGITAPFAIATIGLSIPPLVDPILNTPPEAIGVACWGVASLAASVGMLALGASKVRRRHERRVALVPTAWTTREGFRVGLAGRF